MLVTTRTARLSRAVAIMVLLAGSMIAIAPSSAQAATPVARCETIFNRTSTIQTATGTLGSYLGKQGSVPSSMSKSGWTCPGGVVDSGWVMNDRWVSTRSSTIRVIDGVDHYTYDVVWSRSCVCAEYTVIGRATWKLWVPRHVVPRLATNSGLLVDTLYASRNFGLTKYKLADLRFRIAFVEDPIGKLQRGYFSELSVVMNPNAPTPWTYTTSKTAGQACGSYSETVGSQERWYLLCNVDVTFLDPTKETTGGEIAPGLQLGPENTRAVGGIKYTASTQTQGDYIYYKFQVRVALGITYHSFVRRVGTCAQTSLSYVVTTLDPYEDHVSPKESIAVHGGRCRFNSSQDY